MDIIKKIAEELEVKTSQVDAAVKLIDEGCTIPFIARYRKEVTGALNDEQLRALDDRLKYLRNLEDRKTQVIASIEEQGKLTEELKEQIIKAETMVLVEDLYRPYKQKRRTRATIAKEKGLEPLAAYIKEQNAVKDILTEAAKYISDEEGKEVNSADEAVAGALDIIAEQTNTTNEAAMKISEATHLITSIAEETNLLALNASIEAARAGEQGKGFGVVASEIQKLAEQTNESAAHIEEIVQELLQDAEKAVETMYGVKEIMHTQSDHVEQTQSAFEQVQSGVQESIEGINRISGHTTRLNDARENVVGIVRNLTAIAEANAAGTEQTSASTTEVGAIMEDISGKSTAMRQAAQELDEGMNIFKL